MEISVNRVNRLIQAIVLGEDAEAVCESAEELQILPILREQCRLQFQEGVIVDLPSDLSPGGPWDSPGFDYEAWKAAGMPENASAFVKPYKAKP